MMRAVPGLLLRAAVSLGCVLASACGGTAAATDRAAEAPPPAVVEHEEDGGVIHVDHPERFRLAVATERDVAPELSVTGVVNPDVSRAVPVVSLSPGRVIDVRARLGDRVRKGQLLLRIQSADVSAAVADFRKATADDRLAQSQLDRARALYDHGAVAKKDLDIAEDTTNKSAIDVDTAAAHLRVLGIDVTEAPTDVVDIVAPVSGVITEQNVTSAAGVKTLDNSPNLFTISDLSRVWIMCDVYERDLPTVRVGDTADIHVTAYPDQVLSGRISDIGAVLDPTIRTAKVRIEVANPGVLRIGMFVTATFHGQTSQPHVVVPATAVLHLHERDWVYVARDQSQFERRAVVGGRMLPGNVQALVSGLAPGQRVVSNALVFQNSIDQ